MKKLFSLLLLSLLTACGGNDDKPASSAAIADSNSPSVIVPANARVMDYSCTERREFTTASGAESREDSYGGVNRYWKDSGFSFSFDEDNNGTYKHLSKYQRYTLEGSRYRITAENTSWEKKDGQWLKSLEQVERVMEKQGNVRHAISNKVNGEDKPYYWETEEVSIDEKITRRVQRHLNPSVRDRNGIHYTQIEITCLETDR